MAVTFEKAVLTDGQKKRLVVLAEHLGKGFGDHILDIRLFGSRARGDAKPWSDTDLAVILRDDAPEDAEDRLREETCKVLDDGDELPLLVPFCLREREFRRHQATRDLLYRDLRDQGIPLLQKDGELWSEEGIEVVGRERDIKFELERANRALSAAKRDLVAEDVGSAASRAYYAAFNAATALLLTEGIERAKHEGIIAEFDRHTAHGRLIGKEYHNKMRELFDLRQVADYGKRYIRPKAARRAVETAEKFVVSATDYCGRWMEQQRNLGDRGR